MFGWLKQLVEGLLSGVIKRQFRLIIENQAVLDQENKLIVNRLEDLELDFTATKSRVFKQFRRFGSWEHKDRLVEGESNNGLEVPEELQLIGKAMGVDVIKAIGGDAAELKKIKGFLKLKQDKNNGNGW